MAITIVQSKASSLGPTATVTLDSHVTAGNTIIVMGGLTGYESLPLAPTDGSNTYHQAFSQLYSYSTYYGGAALHYAYDVAGGNTTISQSYGTAPCICCGGCYDLEGSFVVMEVAGLTISNPFDVQATATNPASYPASVTSPATNYANELVVFGFSGMPPYGTSTPTVGSPFTPVVTSSGVVSYKQFLAYNVVSSTGTQTGTLETDYGAFGVATFKIAAVVTDTSSMFFAMMRG